MGINRGTVLDLINDVHRAGGFKDYNSYSYLFNQVDTMPESVEKPEPHWIPVTKDLPKESGHYIVTTRTVCLPINLLHPELDRYSNNVRIDYFRANDNKFDLPSTVAWWSEPLPEPYEWVTE